MRKLDHMIDYYELERRVDDSGTVDELVQILDELRSITSSTTVPKESLDVLTGIFRSLRDVTSDNPDLAGQIILQRLLPYVEGIDDSADDTRFKLEILSEILAKWLAQYSLGHELRLRNIVLNELCRYLAAGA